MTESKSEEDLIADRDYLLGLQKTQGYQDFIAAMTQEANNVTNEIMRPISSQDDILAEQYKKGVIAGLLFAGSWVNSQIERINEDLHFIEKKRGVEDEE